MCILYLKYFILKDGKLQQNPLLTVVTLPSSFSSYNNRDLFAILYKGVCFTFFEPISTDCRCPFSIKNVGIGISGFLFK